MILKLNKQNVNFAVTVYSPALTGLPFELKFVPVYSYDTVTPSGNQRL